MAKNTNDGQTSECDTRITSSITISSKDHPDERDNFTPVVEQIIAREKENKDAVRKLRDMIIKDRKKRIELKLAVQTKEEGADDLTRQVDQTEKAVKAALNDLKNMVPKSPDHEDRTREREREDPNLEPILAKLKRTLNDLTDEIGQKEDYLRNCAPEDEKRRKDEPDQMPTLEEKEHELADAKGLLAELKQIIKKWLQKLAKLLGYEKSVETEEKFSTFPNGINRIIEFIDKCIAAELEWDRLKRKREELEAKKKELHDKVEKHLRDRKPLDLLPNRIRNDYHQIIRKRENTNPLPEVTTDLASHLEALYKWGLNELEQGERQLNGLGRKIKEAKGNGDGDDRIRQLHKDSKDDEIEKISYQLLKAQEDNKKLRAELEQRNENVEAKQSSTVQFCQDVRTVIDWKETRDEFVTKTTVKIENDTRIETEKRRQLEDTLNQLRRQKARQEEELNELQREINDFKTDVQGNRYNDSDRRRRLEERLEQARKDKKDLMDDTKRKK